MVVQTMAVLRKSSAASTREARTESELVRTITAIFPARRTALATKLMYMATVTIRLLLSKPSSSDAANVEALGPFSILSPNKGVSSSGSLYKALGVRLTLTLALLPLALALSFASGNASGSSEGGDDGSSDMVCGMFG